MSRPIDNFPIHLAFGAIYFLLLAIALGILGKKPGAWLSVALSLISLCSYSAAMAINAWFR